MKSSLIHKSLFFHDGNIVSLTWTGVKKSFKCKLTLDLYENLDSANRTRKVLIFRKLQHMVFNGDFVKIALNYSAGSIEDGVIEEFDGYQKLSIQLTGGELVIEGLLEIQIEI